MFSPIRFVFTTIILAGSVLLISIPGTRIVRFFVLTDEFRVDGSRLVCEQPRNNRCVMHYTIDRPGMGADDFVPFGEQFSFYPLESGLSFKKNRRGFTYELNGRTERWPALWGQLRMLALGFLGLLVWFAIGGLGVLRSWLNLASTSRVKRSI